MILMHSDYMTYSRALGLSNMLLFQLISYCSSIPWTDYLFSGHLPVHCKLKAVKFSFKRSQISFRKVKSISADILQDELSSTDLCENTLSYDLEGLFKCYSNTLLSVLNHTMHLWSLRQLRKDLDLTSWLNQGTVQKKNAERLRGNGTGQSDFLMFKAKKNHATFIIRNTMRNYYTDFIQENSNDQHKLFRSTKIPFDQDTDLTYRKYIVTALC